MSLDFKPVETGDQDIFKRYLMEDPPEISELTFTNLFMWQRLYHPVWAEQDNTLMIIMNPDDSSSYGLQPVGRGDKKKAIERMLDYLAEKTEAPMIKRAGESFVNSTVDRDKYTCTLDRDNSDYVYKTIDLIELSGRKYHRKKNHLNQFKKNYQYEYRELDKELVESFINMQEEWCKMRECVENPDLLSEDYAVRRALIHFEELGYKGGAIILKGRVEAFSLGEALNRDTAVIHIEKANPDIPGLYTAINQIFAANAWPDTGFINREQDLGIEGLRKAEESDYPDHMVNKYTIARI
ncbi:MAG: DUF2156 domain-containing protein [Deltaproteobacteria bacterium]|nr:DUF2156 domain-containing protein [Deltaproteobacteria bacterium]